jgi:hypothetical protein
MDEDQALAVGVAVMVTIAGLCCLACGLHRLFIRERITEDSTSLLA